MHSTSRLSVVIITTNLKAFNTQEFSKITTPDFEIAKAVRASVSMPGLFTPVEDDNKLLVDGDLLKSTPFVDIINIMECGVNDFNLLDLFKINC